MGFPSSPGFARGRREGAIRVIAATYLADALKTCHVVACKKEVSVKRSLSLLVLGLVSACGGDTGFSNTKTDPGSDVGTGRLEVEPSSLDFPDLQVGYALTKYMVLESVGDDKLVVYDLRIIAGNGVFQTERLEDLTIAEGDRYEVAVTATLAEALEADGTLRVESNDPDQINFDVPLHATPAAEQDTGTE
jgi:hypothetical protein